MGRGISPAATFRSIDARESVVSALTAAVVRKKWRCAGRSGLSPNNQALDGTFPSEYS